VTAPALGAARALNSGNPGLKRRRSSRPTFPSAISGRTSRPTDLGRDFFTLTTDATTGVNTVTVTAASSLPTTFMRLASLTKMDVKSSGQATRKNGGSDPRTGRSSSIGSKWNAVRDSARTFINSFDANSDRVRPRDVRNGARVVDAMRPPRGSNKSRSRPTSRTRFPAAARTWWKGCIEGGTRSGRFKRHAVGSPRHRAVHRRRVQQRSPESGPGRQPESRR
jgi:hypothetical protein